MSGGKLLYLGPFPHTHLPPIFTSRTHPYNKHQHIILPIQHSEHLSPNKHISPKYISFTQTYIFHSYMHLSLTHTPFIIPQVYDALTAKGLRVWWDKRSLQVRRTPAWKVLDAPSSRHLKPPSPAPTARLGLERRPVLGPHGLYALPRSALQGAPRPA